MNKNEILSLPGMPPGNPSYRTGPYRFVDRQYFNVVYECEAEAIRAMVPERLEPDGSNTAVYEWIDMPDSSGFGAYKPDRSRRR
ncbi:acetoacetate decarboxylase family protein [Aurantimonas sp. C2-6-R+9]|uniref:acetoacetate decarboxylase family protein n=1 Tax=unclassified Aurantimonas TaxID=2638230 RepID=UPI002E1958EC|nr:MULTISPECIES: acetoacetate decarboxylase family protein [unclassified Aurantimonas]MEC5293257.1 acetoacetate decarboxylase family protein [Aurantimonas sp. C2-3-R2]MEC5383419.1 acetoacetate decarboxylase family protein [Aurantimonas sp. C2-6-R+9]MEC5414351.1 acetoacetate decarboxylase family protein [Aurantimonas sp. C2-4-R8]